MAEMTREERARLAALLERALSWGGLTGGESHDVRVAMRAAYDALPALLAACEAAERERDEAVDRADTADSVMRDIKASRDAAEARARDAYRQGQERMREEAIQTCADLAEQGLTKMHRGAAKCVDRIAALPLTDAEEVDRG